MEHRQVPVDAVDEPRVDGGRDVRPSSDHSSADAYFRAFDRNATFWTSPFIVVPNVRLKLPSDVKNADITFSRSARFGRARRSANAA